MEMKIEWSKEGSSPDGMVALAIAAAMLAQESSARQQFVLSAAVKHLPKGVGKHNDEARRMIAEMLKQH